MKKFLLFLLLITTSLSAEPELPDGYELLFKVIRCEIKGDDFAVYKAEVVKPDSCEFKNQRYEIAVRGCELKDKQYFALKNIVINYLAVEAIQKTNQSSMDDVISSEAVMKLGASQEEAATIFGDHIVQGVGESCSWSKGQMIRRTIREMMAGEVKVLTDSFHH